MELYNRSMVKNTYERREAVKQIQGGQTMKKYEMNILCKLYTEKEGKEDRDRLDELCFDKRGYGIHGEEGQYYGFPTYDEYRSVIGLIVPYTTIRRDRVIKVLLGVLTDNSEFKPKDRSFISRVCDRCQRSGPCTGCTADDFDDYEF